MAISFFGKYSSGRGPRKEKKTIHSLCAPPLSAGGVELSTQISKMGGLDEISTFRGGLLGKRG